MSHLRIHNSEQWKNIFLSVKIIFPFSRSTYLWMEKYFSCSAKIIPTSSNTFFLLKKLFSQEWKYISHYWKHVILYLELFFSVLEQKFSLVETHNFVCKNSVSQYLKYISCSSLGEKQISTWKNCLGTGNMFHICEKFNCYSKEIILIVVVKKSLI